MKNLESVEEKIAKILRSRFNPVQLVIDDESHMHAGHAGAPSGGESHFRITIKAQEFSVKPEEYTVKELPFKATP